MLRGHTRVTCEIPDLKARLNKKLDTIGRLGPNWDGYGTDAINPFLIQAARRVVDEVLSPEKLPEAKSFTYSRWRFAV